MAFDSHKNFATSTVGTAPSPASSGTTLVLSADFNPAPTPPYNIVICPVSTAPTTANAEIARVTADSSGTLTITRAQEGTSARTVVVGDQVFAAVTAKSLTDIETGIAAGVAPNASGGLVNGAIAATIPRYVSLSGSLSLASGTLYLAGVELPANTVCTSITFCSAFGGAINTGTHQLFGIFDDSLGTSSGTGYALLRGSTDDTSTAWSQNTTKTLNLTSTYTTTRSGFHYLGIMCTANTAPQLRATTSDSIVGALASILCGTSSTGLTALPNPAAAPTFGGGVIPVAWVS